MIRKLEDLIEAHKTFKREFQGKRTPMFLLTRQQLQERKNKILLGYRYD